MNRSTSPLASGMVLSSAFFLMAACGGGSGDVEGAGGGGGACTQYVNALVGFADRCGDGVTADFTANRARFEAACDRALSAPGAPSNIAAQISSCAQKISSASCTGTEEVDCEITGGTLDDGAACGENYQCKSGACRTASGSTCGTCVAKVAVGGECTGSSECVDGAECQFGNNDSGTCVVVKIAKAGEPCANTGSGELVRCDTGLDCSFNSSEPTCKAPGPAGSDCTSRYDCEFDLRCVAGKCATGLAEGAACSMGECGKGLDCSQEGKCARITIVKAGEECDAVRRCERGTCNGQSFTSEPGGQVKVTPGKCVDPLPDGADCSNDDTDIDAPRCDTFAECLGGKCTLVDPAQCK